MLEIPLIETILFSPWIDPLQPSLLEDVMRQPLRAISRLPVLSTPREVKGTGLPLRTTYVRVHAFANV
jgi:hypothetical protein